MRFAIDYNGKETIIDIALWESTINNRIEYYAVFANQQETFINFVKCAGQSTITEVSSSADLNADTKAIIKEKLICCLQLHH